MRNVCLLLCLLLCGCGGCASPPSPTSLPDPAGGLEAKEALSALIPVLDEEPVVNWDVHIALLDCLSRCGSSSAIAPKLDALRGVDHLEVQEQIGRFDLKRCQLDPVP